MSTRCQIGFYSTTNAPLKKFDALLYKHSDGYPGESNEPDSGMIPLLMPFLIEFNENRGLEDSDYAAAWCMHYLIDKIVERYKNRQDLAKSNWAYIGYSICKNLHGDIEYYYAVYPDRLDVFEINRPNPKKFDFTWKDMQIIRTISIADCKLQFEKNKLKKSKEKLEQLLEK